MNAYKMPIVSVVVPMYNVERYIEKCIRSILNQSYQNFEIICVDDGCTDSTTSILKSINDRRIRLIKQKNMGLSAARNTGINAAKGLYIALLDSDDFWAQEKLSCHVAHLNNNPKVGISYCPSKFVDDDDHDLGIGQYPKINNISAKDILCRNPIGNGSAPVIRRSLLNDMREIDISEKNFRACYFDENMRQSEDIEFWIRVALNTQWKFEGIEPALTYYRVNSGGLSANLSKQFSAWKYAIDKNRKNNEVFFKRWYSLSKAYQLRYLARRAVKSGNSSDAISLINKALRCDIRILIEEPARTIATYACSLLSLLPKRLYNAIERTAISFSTQPKHYTKP